MKIVPHLRIRLTLLAVIALCIAGPTRAQEAEWQRLYKEAVSLYTQGNHAQAMDAARESLTVAEKTFGPDHLLVAGSLHAMAMMHKSGGQYNAAEPLFERALAIGEKSPTPDRANLASILNALAELYDIRGAHALSEQAYLRALAIREEALGPDHLDLATTLNDLALFYKLRDQYDKAEPLYKRALAMRRKLLGDEHLLIADSLSHLAIQYKAQKRYAQAEPLLARALAIREKILGRDHIDVATNLNSLAGNYYYLAQYALAEPLFARALAIREKQLGPNHYDVAVTLNDLAALYNAQIRFDAAEPLYQRALAVWEKALGSDHPRVAASLVSLASLQSEQGRYARAEPLLKRALAIRERTLGSEHQDVAKSLNSLAELYREQGYYALAEPLYKRALAIREKATGSNYSDVAESLNNLAILHHTRGQYAEAASMFKRALSIHEKFLGSDHPDVATNLSNLAQVYYNQAQYPEAEALLRRALAIREKALGPDHPDVATALNGMAVLYSDLKKYEQQEPLLLRARAIWEKAYGPHHPNVAQALGNLAALYRIQGRYDAAEPLELRALAIREAALGPDHPDVARSLVGIASLYREQRQFAQAEQFELRALEVRQKSLGMEHLRVAQSLNRLAELHHLQTQYAQALPLARRASAIYRKRIAAGGADDAAVREASMNRRGFLRHLSLLSDISAAATTEAVDTLADEAFQIAQLEQTSGTASAIAKMAARFASGDDALANLVKAKQDAAEHIARAEGLLLNAASKSPELRKPSAEQGLRDDIIRLGQTMAGIDDELTQRFPEYQQLIRPDPLDLSRTQALLRPGEAMLVYVLDHEQRAFMWVIRPDIGKFLARPLDAKALAAKVAAIRSAMEFDSAGHPAPVDLSILHGLYRSLFEPVLPHLAGVDHVMVIAAGALQSLPLGMLVASPPPQITSDADYRQADWLASHYAFSVLPSVSSIQALRQFARKPGEQKPFAGIGDPLIGNAREGAEGSSDKIARGKRTRVDVAAVFRNLVLSTKINPNAAVIVPAGENVEIADVEAIRGAPRLAETADELRAMAKALKSDANSLWLQQSATESTIKRLDLARYRTLAFATHGVMAGEIKGIGEPGLILTPPQQGSPEDDGYLSSSEIARLKLNADWVVLSACNTAAADGTPGAEGLSGLAKAFFYAGARSLLVSHWPVASEATVLLTTVMMKEYEANPGNGKAEAQRKAMLALIATPDHPEYAHPMFWAPFVVVGEGGTENWRP